MEDETHAVKRSVLAHPSARCIFVLGCTDTCITAGFAFMPDTRIADSDNVSGVFTLQMVLSWLNVVVSASLVLLIWATFAVPSRDLTFERQSRVGYLIVFKVWEILVDMALTGYPTPLRNTVCLSLAFLRLVQIVYCLRVSATCCLQPISPSPPNPTSCLLPRRMSTFFTSTTCIGARAD